MANPIEEVARVICLGAMLRKWPNAQHDFLERRVEQHWEDFQPDARVVMAKIDELVHAEEIEDMVASLPVTPSFLVGDETVQ